MKTENLVRHLSLHIKYSVSYEWQAQVPIALPIGTNFLIEQKHKIERISDLVVVIKKLTKTTEDTTFRRMTEVAGAGVLLYFRSIPSAYYQFSVRPWLPFSSVCARFVSHRLCITTKLSCQFTFLDLCCKVFLLAQENFFFIGKT